MVCVECLIPKSFLTESLLGLVFLGYVMLVLWASKLLYERLVGRGFPTMVSVYFVRKFIHVFAGGFVALAIPFLFTSPIIPTSLALVLAFLTYIPHRRGKLMYWFQVEENMYEVNFCIMWGLSIFLGWLLLGSSLYALIPVVFVSFGDAVTGVVRNLIYRRRTKSWVGNLAMFTAIAPAGYFLAGWLGIVAAGLSSIVEHFEFPPIDDNILVPATALAVVLVGIWMKAI